MSTFIYALLDPGTDDIRYVGKSDDPPRRLTYHIQQAKHQHSHKAHWIMTLLRKNTRPDLRILAEVSDDNWEQEEMRYIAEAIQAGHVLTNGDSGGRGGRRATTELRLRLSNQRMGVRLSEETKQKISKAHIGMKHDKRTKHKMSASHIGKTASDLTRQKMSETRTGRTHSDETKAKCSAAKKGVKFSDSHRQKLSEAAKRRKSVRRMEQ